MATIKTTLQLYNGVSAVSNTMARSMGVLLNTFESLQMASGQAVDVSAFQDARDEISRLAAETKIFEDEINSAANAQNNLNNNISDGGSRADIFSGKLKAAAAALGAAFSVSKVIELSDGMTQTAARLDLMNDGLQSTAQLQDMIMQSANRSRASYLTTADAAAKLGVMAKDAFSSSGEIVAFLEQVNKQFTIAGTSAQGVDAAMLQLTQAMASGVLRGEELNSVFEQAPTIIQTIADYMDIPIGQIRAMAREGQLSAEIVKNAMFWAADQTNAQFEQMSYTFAQIGTLFKNSLLQTFEPVIQTIGRGAQYIHDNWATIAPVFWGIVAALGAYAAITAIQTAVTWLQVAANQALIVTLLNNPIMWLAILIGLIISRIYEWVQAVGGIKIAWAIASDKMLTAMDYLKVGFFTGIYFIMNLFDNLSLAAQSAGVAIANFMGDMRVSTLQILQNMVNGAIDIINGFINTLNSIPGVSIDTIQHVTFAATAQVENEAAKTARAANLDAYRQQMERNAIDREEKLGQLRQQAESAHADRLAEITRMQADNAKGPDDSNYDFENYGGLAGSAADTAANTARMADSMEATFDELKYLREIAERQAIDQFTTATITIDMSNMQATLNEPVSVDEFVDTLTTGIEDAVAAGAEGVHV